MNERSARRRPSARRRGSQRDDAKLPLVPLMIGAIVVLLAVAVVAVSIGDDDSDGGDTDGLAQTQPVAITGEPLPRFAGGLASADDPALGKTAPTIAGKDFAGDPVTISDDGTPKMLLFVAHTCPHCRAEVPRLRAWLDDHTLGDVALYIVSSNVAPDGVNYPPSAWLEREGLGDVPTIADDEASAAATAYGLSSFPYFVLVDADGTVVGRLSGELGESGEGFTTLFDALAAGEPIVDPRA